MNRSRLRRPGARTLPTEPPHAHTQPWIAPFAAKAIYGLLTVLALLVAMEEHPPTPLRASVTLFGAIFGIALAEAYSEWIAEMLAHRRPLSREELRGIWRVVAPVMLGAQPPTVVLLISALGFLPVETAIDVGQWTDLALLYLFGVRVGRVAQQTWPLAIGSGAIATATGALIILVKSLFH